MQAQRQLTDTLAHLDALTVSEAVGADSMTPEQWQAHLTSYFHELAPDDLELAVGIWLRRRGYTMSHAGGQPYIVAQDQTIQ